MEFTPQEITRIRALLQAFADGKTISDLPKASALQGGEAIEIEQGNESRQILVSDLPFGGNCDCDNTEKPNKTLELHISDTATESHRRVPFMRLGRQYYVFVWQGQNAISRPQVRFEVTPNFASISQFGTITPQIVGFMTIRAFWTNPQGVEHWGETIIFIDNKSESVEYLSDVSLAIPEIRVSSISGTRGDRLLYIEPFHLPENIEALNPVVVIRRQRDINGRATTARCRLTGAPKANKQKWCDVEHNVNAHYLRQKRLVRPLVVSLADLSASTESAEKGMFLSFPNRNNPIRTERDLCEVFTVIERSQNSVRFAVAAKGTTSRSNFKVARSGYGAVAHGTIGVCLRVDNPAFFNAPENPFKDRPAVKMWRNIPRHLYGDISKLLISVHIDGSLNERYSLKPKR